MDYLHLHEQQVPVQAGKLRLRCPYCLVEGLFENRGQDLEIRGDGHDGWEVSAQRICPNLDCRGLIFIVYDARSNVIQVSYPPERIDFDATDLPESIKEPLAEAIDCHAHGSFKAAALMIRRTLEALCEDQGAKGSTLVKRIEALSGQVGLPPSMVGALHDVRLLGNDAAHVEARTYVEVGKQEVEAGLEVTKFILAST